MILTVLGLSVMNTSHLEMKMAANAQFGNQAFQAAESAIDSVMRIPKATLLTFVGGAPTARDYFFNETTAVGFPDGSQFFAETAATLTTFQETGNVPGGGFSVSEDAQGRQRRITSPSKVPASRNERGGLCMSRVCTS